MSRRLPDCEVTLALWQEVCEWLDQQYGKARYRDGFPYEWQWLFVMGSPDAAEARRVAGWPIFYWEGKGWRLHKGWRERLADSELAKGAQP